MSNSAVTEASCNRVAAPKNVSPAMSKYIAESTPFGTAEFPTTRDSWIEWFRNFQAEGERPVPAFAERKRVAFERKIIAGVPVFALTPSEIHAANTRRIIVHLHGGAFMVGAGLMALPEAILMAAYSYTKVYSVDYRLAPKHPYPAALDDALAVWRVLIEEHDPKGLAIVGGSAGGNLTIALVQRAIQEGLPLPAAIGPGTPWVDLAGTGDSYMLNARVDPMPIPALAAAAELYANGIDLRDPRVSPIYGSFSGFPPSILTAGTRDLLLSDTVRLDQRLREAGVETKLQVFEGQRHGDYAEAPLFLTEDPPETKFAFGSIAQFLDSHLGLPSGA